jgi:hypothetical protein
VEFVMTETAANIWGYGISGFQTVTESASRSARQLAVKAPAKDVLILGSFLAILQILDGVLTGIGMAHFGTSAEGNLFLKFLMDTFGYVTALVVVKTIALAVIAALCMLAEVVTWLKGAMLAVILIYLGAAIIPWTMIITTHIL